MINDSYIKHSKILFWVWESCERETKRKKERKRDWRGKETHWTPLEITYTNSLLLKSAAKMGELSIYSKFRIWFLTHTIQITLNDWGGKELLFFWGEGMILHKILQLIIKKMIIKWKWFCYPNEISDSGTKNG